MAAGGSKSASPPVSGNAWATRHFNWYGSGIRELSFQVRIDRFITTSGRSRLPKQGGNITV
jgi:hypothetical protein